MTKTRTGKSKGHAREPSGGGGMVGNEEKKVTAGPASTEFRQVGPNSDPTFETIHTLLTTSCLVPESTHCFQYSQASFVVNAFFTEEFKAFALQKKESGYKKEELEECFAFLLFDNESEAKLVCQNGLHVGNSSITTLGDPAAGVYISKFADYLHPRPWYHGKSGYVVIFKLIKGKVKVVPENYTTNYTVPSPGYDCHLSAKNSKISAKTSHFQAFELNQYYVYELNKGSIVKRPRQVCPYVILAFQYSEPEHTIPDKNRIGLNTEEFYNAWSGQLLILDRLVCNVAFRSPFSASLPAQLSDKLEIKDVMNISDLKKKLPEDIFDKCNYTDTEVCYEGVYCSLYEVMASSPVEKKLDKLKKQMKNKDLAIIKLLRDQGFLILITSSVLKPTQEPAFEDSVDLHALFLFASSRITCLTGGSSLKDIEEFKVGKRGDKISATVTTLLPGLKYALRQAKEAEVTETMHGGAQVEEYFQEFFRSQQGALSPVSLQSDCSSNPSPLSFDMWPDSPKPEVCSKLAFSQLSNYISNSSMYVLEVSKAQELFTRCSKSPYLAPEKSIHEALPSVTSPDMTHVSMELDTAENDDVDIEGQVLGTEKSVNKASEKKSPKKPKGKRKFRKSILSVKRKKKLAPKIIIRVSDRGLSLKRTNPTVSDVGILPTKGQGIAQAARETTLKLASASSTYQRKRGAEVLTAEVVRSTETKVAAKPVPLPDEHHAAKSLEDHAVPSQEVEAALRPEDTAEPTIKRSKRLIKSPLKGFPADNESSRRVNGKTIIQSKSIPVRKPNEKQPPVASKPLSRKTILLARSALENGDAFTKTIEAVVKSSSTEKEAFRKRLPAELYESEEDVSVLAQRLSIYESHALNLLADLALSSGSAYNPAVLGENLSLEEQQALLGEKLGRSGSDHEYSRTTRHPKGSPGSISKSTLATYLQSENGSAVEESNAKQVSGKSNGMVSKVRPDTFTPKKVILEHSYASSSADQARKGQLLKGSMAPTPKNRAKGWQEGAPVGRVLPFRPQEDSTCLPKESEFLTEKRKRGILGHYKGSDCPRTVFRRYGKVKVTFIWEEEYLFSGDSKYTSDPLEKTINRALHGPWNADIPNHVEDVKLILHMWIALFYSKPSKLLNSASRKVVEHNNPAKYVSINSTLDSFELFEDCNGGNKHDVGFADSPSEVEDATYNKLSPVLTSASQNLINEPSSTSSFKSRSHLGGHSITDDGQQCVTSSGYFDSSCSNYMVDEHETTRDEFVESEPFEEITSSVAQIEENDMEIEELVVPKTVADICNSVPQVSVHGFEREELKKSVTVVEICSNVPQVEREELLESENVVDICGIEPQIEENEPEREDFMESDAVEEACSNTVQQVNENITVIEDTPEPSPAAEDCNSTPQVEENENEIGKEVLYEPEHFVEICTSTSQVDENLPEKEPLLQSEPIIEVCTSTPQVDQNQIGFTEPESVVEICSSVSQVTENETEKEAVTEPGKVVEICSSTPQVLCPILVSSFPEIQCRVLKKYIIAKKRGGQLTEWSTQLYNMVDGTQIARQELRRPPTVVDLSSSSIPQVFQVSETVSARGGFLEPQAVVEVRHREPQVSEHRTEEVLDFGVVEEACSTDPQLSETVTEEVVESEIVTDLGDGFPFHNCYDPTLAQEGESHSLNTEIPVQKEASTTTVEMSEHVENAQPVVYYETVVSENDSSAGDVVITLEDKEDYQAPSVEMSVPRPEFSVNQEHRSVLDHNSGKFEFVKDSECTSTNVEVNARDSVVQGSSYSVAKQNGAFSRGVHSRIEDEYNEAKPYIAYRAERTASDGWVVYKHVSLQQSDNVDNNAKYEHPAHQPLHVSSQKEIVDISGEDSVTEQTTAAETGDSVKNNEHEECVLYFENIVDISSGSSVEEGPVGNVLDLEEREFAEEVLPNKSPPNTREEPPGPPPERCSWFPKPGEYSESADQADWDRRNVSAAVPFAEDQKDVSEGLKSDHHFSQQTESALKEPDSIPECSRVDVSDISTLRRDDNTHRTRLKRHHCKNAECEGENCTCEQELAHLDKWSPYTPCSKKYKGFSDMVKDVHYRPTRTYRNFSVTKDVKETRLAVRGLPRDQGFSERSDFLTSWTNRCVARDDITRSTLDLEYLRFIHNVNQVIRSQTVYTPAADERFPHRKMPEARCRSPLVITVMRSEPRRSRVSGYSMQEDYEESSCKSRYQEKSSSSRHSKRPRPPTHEQATSFHFSKLNCKSKPIDQRDNITACKASSDQSSVPAPERPDIAPERPDTAPDQPETSADQPDAAAHQPDAVAHQPDTAPDQLDTEPQQEQQAQKDISASFTQEPVVLQSIITDLCSNLHARLSSVASKACKQLLVFYILEIEAEPYFSEIKTMLKKDGYTEMEPAQFCQAERSDDSILTIILRNEDIAEHVQEIPDLLQLKMLPCVTFAGVDCPEDITDCTYQKLFHSGGFVVSDENVLETVTLAQLQDILKLLEKLNRHERWKWFLHYRESKKIKEESRVESVAKKKLLLIKSRQESSIVEVLHYHQCDSRSAPKSDNLACLLNLHIQHISTRFAVFLTDKPSSIKEVCKRHGILVADVTTFVETVQKLTSTFKVW